MMFPRSLRARTLLAVLIPSLLSTACVAVVMYRAHHRMARDMLEHRESRVANIAAASLAEELNRFGRILGRLAMSDHIRSLEPASVARELAGAEEQLRVFDAGVGVYAADGTAVASFPYPGAPFPLPELLGGLSGSRGPVFSAIFSEPRLGVDAVLLAVPIRGSRDEFLGAVAGTASLRRSLLWTGVAKLLEFRDEGSGYGYLVDGRGRVVYHRHGDLLGRDLSGSSPVKQVTRGGKGTLLAEDPRGRQALIGFTPVPGTGWAVVTELSWTVVTEPVRGYLTLTLAFMGLATVLALSLVFLFVNRTLRPVKHLTQMTRRLAHRDFDIHLSAAPGDEIATLTLGFNQMAEALNRAFAEVQQQLEERRLAEEALRQSEGRFRALVESSASHIFMLDREGTYLASNDRVAKFGLTTGQELVGRNLRSVYPSEVAELYEERLKQVFDSLQPARFEHTLEEPDGLQYHYDILYPLVRDGKVWALGGVCHRITELKQAEQEVRRLSQFLESIIDNADVWLHVRAIDHRVLIWNTAAENVSGYSKEEVVGSDQVWERLYPEEAYREEVEAKAVEVMETGEVLLGYETTIRCRDGKQRTMAWHVRNLKDGSGTPIGLVGLGRDVTETKLLQAQLLQAQKMEAVGRLAGGVAHDFNNMLQTILGYSELALQEVKTDTLLHESLLEIRKAGERSAALTRQLLAFARKQTVSPQVLDLNGIVSGMLKMLRRLIGEDIELAWMPGLDLWEVKIDPSQIDQILANLVVNARDAITGVGKITMETDNVQLDDAYCAEHMGFVAGEYARLTVSDDGCGMDKEILEHLFEPFFTTKEKGQGTGLGLATVYGIVKQNKGFVNVYSEPGKGTAIRIYLPRFRGEAAEVQVEGPAETVRGGTETVLTVEDDVAILTLGKRILEGLGYTVLSANTPTEAIGLVEEHPGEIHLLITDVVLPEMNGRDLAQRLGSLRPDLKCLYMSGYTANVIARRGVLDPGVHFIPKPFSPKDLAAKVRSVLDA